MRHINTVAFALSCLFAVACGSDPGAEYQVDSEEELGQIEQPYIYLDSATRQWGTQTGPDQLSCNKTSTGQTCTFAQFKKIELARPNAWTTSQKNTLSLLASALQSRFTGWTFTVADSSAAPAAGFVRLLFASGAVAGSLSSTVNGYRTVNFFSPVSLTEGQQAGLAAPVGNYQRHGSCSATIDFADIEAKGATSSEDLKIQDHIIGNAIMVCMGVGTRNDTPLTLSQRTLNPSSTMSAGSAGEVCRASISETTDMADISRQTASACAD
jgi:hypothetical protein